MSLHAVHLSIFTKELKKRKQLPKNIEFTRIGSIHMVNAFDKIESLAISESISVGMDENPDLATLKALVERAERQAFGEGKSKGLQSCATIRSDGFAAYPAMFPGATAAARANAFNEAVERYGWAFWWDNKEIGHEFIGRSDSRVQVLLQELQSFLPVSNIVIVSPKVEGAAKSKLIIYFAFLRPYGVISGGACGEIGEESKIQFRAACELARHGLALRKILREGVEPSTFYEKRLAYFGNTREGTQTVHERLKNAAGKSLSLPKLAVNESVAYSLSDLIVVHRCLFENQPPFVGGNLERLCL